MFIAPLAISPASRGALAGEAGGTKSDPRAASVGTRSRSRSREGARYATAGF